MYPNEIFKVIRTNPFGDPEDVLDTYKNSVLVFLRQFVKVFTKRVDKRPVGSYVLKLVRFEKCPIAPKDFLDIAFGDLLEMLPYNVRLVSALTVCEDNLGVSVKRFIARQLEQIHKQLVRAVVVVTNSSFHFLVLTRQVCHFS
jgi:hypothetical protein